LLDFDEFAKLIREREEGHHSDVQLRHRFDALDIDGSGQVSLDEYLAWSLRDALIRSSERVLDLFQEWDADGSGSITRAELFRAVKALGFDAAREQVDALFDELDAGKVGSHPRARPAPRRASDPRHAPPHGEPASSRRLAQDGKVDYKELNMMLRSGAGSQHDTSARAAVAGGAAVDRLGVAGNRRALKRVSAGSTTRGALAGLTIDLESDEQSAQEQLREYREWRHQRVSAHAPRVCPRDACLPVWRASVRVTRVCPGGACDAAARVVTLLCASRPTLRRS
jgi:Ca2+-binding EF-hand superfamily protein